MKNQVLNKIVSSMMESYFFINQFFLAASFRPSSKLPRHTGLKSLMYTYGLNAYGNSDI
jgi:hypothetical protein